MEDKRVRKFHRVVGQTARAEKHKFASSILQEVDQWVEPDNLTGVREVAEDWLVVFGVAWLSKTLARCCLGPTPSLLQQADPRAYALFLAQGAPAWALALAGYLFAVLVIGGRQRALADILHQASHGALARTWWWNNLLGTACSGYTVLQSLTVYRSSHVQLHHVYLGNPHRDPDYQGIIANNLCGAHRSRKRTLEYLWGLLTPANSVAYLRYVARNRIWDETEVWYESAARLAYFALVGYVVTVCDAWRDVVLFWVVPFVTSNVWIGSLLELLEHFPMVDATEPFQDLKLTKNRVADWLTNLLLGVHWEGYHLVHHLFPKVPSWNYEKVHRILLQDAEYAALDHGRAGWRHMVAVILRDADLAPVPAE